MKNIVLIGMPGCGKTTLGKMLAVRLKVDFYDADDVLEAREPYTIKEFFAQGEDVFREAEQRTAEYLSQKEGCIIAAGGGVVKRPENVRALRQNGPVVFIDRPLELLCTGGGRPLSTDRAALAAMEEKRRPLYKAAADIRIPNNTDVFRRAAKAAEEALHAYFGT